MTDARIREAAALLERIPYHESEIADHRRRIAGHEEQIRLARERIEKLRTETDEAEVAR